MAVLDLKVPELMSDVSTRSIPPDDGQHRATREIRHEYTRNLPSILAGLNVSLLVSTYQAGKVVGVGVADGVLALSYHNFERAMGLAVRKEVIAVGARAQIWFLHVAPDLAPRVEPAGRHDACYVTRSSRFTGEIQGHEMAWSGEDLWIVNTAFSCVCTLHPEHSFEPRWRPPFVSALGWEDQCHLKVYFSGPDPAYGRELFETDGTQAGTTLVKDISQGIGSSYADAGNQTQLNQFAVLGGVKDINPGANSSYPGSLISFDGNLIFAANDGVDGSEMWQSNGTATGTSLFRDIDTGPNGSGTRGFTNFDGKLFFRADDGMNGVELWTSDGTASGTTLLRDINPAQGYYYYGTNYPGAQSSYPGQFTAVGGTLFFTANDGTDGNELWRSDGTADGTVMVKDINPGATGSVSTSISTSFAIAGAQLFFAADDGTHGRELWESDGTTAGTKLVMDVNPGGSDAFSADGQVITSVNGSLYFAANDGTHGIEPWMIPGDASAKRRSARASWFLCRRDRSSNDPQATQVRRADQLISARPRFPRSNRSIEVAVQRASGRHHRSP